MYNSKLRDYVRVYSSFLNQEFCKSIVSNFSDAKWSRHQYYHSRNHNFNSYENEPFFSMENVPLKNDLDLSIWKVLSEYILNDMKDCSEWFNGWDGYSASRLNKYDPSTLMRVHCDHIHTLFDGEAKGIPILTVLGVLNEDYEGGEFMLCGERIELKTGDVIVFPSNFLYPHEVKPVKSGVRYSFVSWAW